MSPKMRAQAGAGQWDASSPSDLCVPSGVQGWPERVGAGQRGPGKGHLTARSKEREVTRQLSKCPPALETLFWEGISRSLILVAPKCQSEI